MSNDMTSIIIFPHKQGELGLQQRATILTNHPYDQIPLSVRIIPQDCFGSEIKICPKLKKDHECVLKILNEENYFWLAKGDITFYCKGLNMGGCKTKKPAKMRICVVLNFGKFEYVSYSNFFLVRGNRRTSMGPGKNGERKWKTNADLSGLSVLKSVPKNLGESRILPLARPSRLRSEAVRTLLSLDPQIFPGTCETLKKEPVVDGFDGLARKPFQMEDNSNSRVLFPSRFQSNHIFQGSSQSARKNGFVELELKSFQMEGKSNSSGLPVAKSQLKHIVHTTNQTPNLKRKFEEFSAGNTSYYENTRKRMNINEILNAELEIN